MLAACWGRVINTGSMHALVASPYKSAYNAAKHGIAGKRKSKSWLFDGRTAGLPCLGHRARSRAWDYYSGQRVGALSMHEQGSAYQNRMQRTGYPGLSGLFGQTQNCYLSKTGGGAVFSC